MPGLTACVQCGTALTAAQVEVHPPRAGRWRLRVRPLHYALNRVLDWAPLGARLGERLDLFLSGALWGGQNTVWAVVSIIPGLGHLLSGRLRSIRWLWPGWLAAMAVGLLLFGTLWGSLAFGLGIGLHCWIVVEAGRIRQSFDTLRGRLLIVAVIYGLFAWGIYGELQREILGAAHPGVAIPSHGIKADDLVLFWDWEPLQRGDVVLFHIPRNGLPLLSVFLPGEGIQIHGGDVVGRLLAFPGEHVAVQGETLTASLPGQPPRRYRLPIRIGFDFELDVPPGRYLCYPQAMNIQNNRLTPVQIIALTGLPNEHQVMGRAWMIYNTFWGQVHLPRIPMQPLR